MPPAIDSSAIIPPVIEASCIETSVFAAGVFAAGFVDGVAASANAASPPIIIIAIRRFMSGSNFTMP